MKLLKQAQTALEQRVASKMHDEAVLQQSRLWMQSITWGLIGTTCFGVAWLSLAKTEEIVVANGKLQPIGSVKEIQMPLGGIAEAILVNDGDRVKAGQVLMRLDTEATEQKRKSLQDSLQLRQQQLALKEVESQRYANLNQDSINRKSAIRKGNSRSLRAPDQSWCFCRAAVSATTQYNEGGRRSPTGNSP